MKISRLPLGDVSANCYILCDEETNEGALVDVGGCSSFLFEEIENIGIKELKYILLTHGHFDHISGALKVKEKFPDVKILISEKDAVMTNDKEKNGADFFKVPFTSFKADVLLNDGDKIAVGNLILSVIETPGHSKGSVCFVNDKEKVIFSGDTLFKLTVGRTDLYGGSDDELKNSIKKLLEFSDDYVVCTGHNITTTIGDERVRNRYIRRIGWEI